MFLGINIFWALLRAYFNPRLTARAELSPGAYAGGGGAPGARAPPT